MVNKEKIVSKKVMIELKNDLNVELDTNSPNIDKLIADIVANRASIDPTDIKVECDDEKFDCQSFREIVQKVVADLVDDITIEETAVISAQVWVNERTADKDDKEDADAASVDED